jgi:IclR family acetate operon transcriptional repressor
MSARAPVAETSVGRALRVVETIAQTGDGVTAKAIARRLGFTLPTTYRLLATLVDEGYLVRLPELRGYGLGYRIGDLARRLADQLAVPWPIQMILHDVHQEAAGATHYAVLRGGQVVVAQSDDCPVHPSPERLRVGDPTAPHAAAAGKVLLAALDRRRLAGVLTDPLPALTGQTMVDRHGFDRELRRVRAAGVAVEVGELLPGLAEVAAPVRAPNGTVIAALGVSVSCAEFSGRQAALEHAVREGAGRAAEALAEQAEAG